MTEDGHGQQASAARSGAGAATDGLLAFGEKRAADMLDMQDWLDVAEGFQRRLRTAAVGAMRRMPWLALLIVVLFVGGVLLLMTFASDSGAIAAGAATVLSSVGLTWKGIGGSLGQIEQPLFGAATDDAVAVAITLLYPDRGGRVGEAPPARARAVRGERGLDAAQMSAAGGGAPLRSRA